MKGLRWAVAEAASNRECQNISNIISSLIISFVFIRCAAVRYRYILLGKVNYWGLRHFICLSSSISFVSIRMDAATNVHGAASTEITPINGIVTP
jgi:hypothetical protein